MSQSRPQVVPANSRGGIVLLADNFRYVRNRTSRVKIIWRCTTGGCGAYLHTNLFDVADDNPAINGKLQAIYFSSHVLIGPPNGPR